jgi:2-polyprenyl-3-methyl-5-hydroxy-6-metoxy-1,4-benzoquinol methylase
MTATATPSKLPGDWTAPFETLRRKWSTVPAAQRRMSTLDLLALSDRELLDVWREERRLATTGAAHGVRGWYHELYKDVFRGKRVLDVGAGLGLDGLTFAEHGAHMTLVDIVESNVELQRRLARLLRLDVKFLYMKDIDALSALPRDFDVVWCQGSLINAPFELIRAECQALLEHLPVGGRWIELAYPKVRWEREGRLPFEQWGAKTDGPGTPWMEWYDLEKLTAALAPARFDTVLYFDFHHADFNWFDLVRRS